MIVVFGNEKGGVGKSTMACNTASYLASSQQKDVVLVDTDRQESSKCFIDARKKSLPKIHCVQKTGDVFESLQDLNSRYEYVIVDAGGHDSVELRSSILSADILMIPIKASQFDAWSIEKINNLLGKVKSFNRSLQVVTVINMASNHFLVKEAEDAKKFIKEFTNVSCIANQIIHERKIFRDAIIHGLGVLEMNNQSKGSLEFMSLMKEAKL